VAGWGGGAEHCRVNGDTQLSVMIALKINTLHCMCRQETIQAKTGKIEASQLL